MVRIGLKLPYVLLAMLVTVLVDQWFVCVHETTHQVIFSYYGIDSEVHVHFLSGETVPNASQMYYLSSNRPLAFLTLWHAQSMVDAIGYQIEPLLVVVTFLLVCILLHVTDPMGLEEW